MSAELWKTIFDWATVVFIAFTVVSGAGALITGAIINSRQESRLRQFDKDLTSAKKDASDAKTAQEKIETELNRQKARAATAEADLIRLKESLKWRSISQAEHAKLAQLLKSTDKGTISIEYPSDDPEAFQFARDVQAVFSDAEWPPIKGNAPQGMLADTNLGLGIIVQRLETAPRYAGAIQKAFNSVGIQMWGLASEKRAENEVVVSVGHRER